MHVVIVILSAMFAFLSAWWMTRSLCSPKSLLSVLAQPNERTLHSRPTPQTGGLAIIVGVVTALMVTGITLAIAEPSKPVFPKGFASGSLWIVISMLLVFVVSFVDDCIGLRASIRLGIQAIAALIVVLGVGLVLSSIPIPGGQPIGFGLAAVSVSVLFLMWMANLYNFMDGMDGFAGGMTFVGFGFLTYLGWEAQYPVMLLIAAFVSMGALGFLTHNFPPARIFMGDAGSITIGFLAGALMILGVRDGIFEIWVPIMIFSPFILDATVTLLRRVLHRKRIWEAHREHYYQRLVLIGWSHRRTVLSEYGVMLCCGGLALWYHHSTDHLRLLILGVWMSVFALLAMFVHRLERNAPRTSHVPDHPVLDGKEKAQAISAEDASRVTVKA